MVKFEHGETKVENKIIRIFLRILYAIIFIFYTGYILYKKTTVGAVDLDNTDYTILASGFVIFLAVEGARAYVNSKLNNNAR